MALQTARHAVEWNYLSLRLMASAINDKEVVGAASYDFLMYVVVTPRVCAAVWSRLTRNRYSGYASMAYQWLRMANVALTKRRDTKEGTEDYAFYTTKVQTAEFFFDRLLPRTRALKQTILASPKTLMQVPEDKF